MHLYTTFNAFLSRHFLNKFGLFCFIMRDINYRCPIPLCRLLAIVGDPGFTTSTKNLKIFTFEVIFHILMKNFSFYLSLLDNLIEDVCVTGKILLTPSHILVNIFLLLSSVKNNSLLFCCFYFFNYLYLKSI